MYWMFGLQAIYYNMNKLNCHLNTSGTCWPQEIPVNHIELVKINVEIPITMPGMPVETT